MQKLIKTKDYSLLNIEIEPSLSIEVFRVWNTYHSLPQQKKVEMLQTLISWSTEQLKLVQLGIDLTINTEVPSFNTK